jgi:arylsulfatase A-like enzyme
MGEHRYVGKIVGYEESLRVPLLIRGPGVPANKNLKAVGATVDIAPTIVAAAGATATHALDGRDLRPVIDGTPSWSTLLIQGGPSASAPDDAGWLYRGVRTARYTYIRYEFPAKQELYDRRHDPYEVASVIGDQRYSGIRRELASRLSLLSECAGSSCRQNFGRVPRPSPR